MTIAKSYPGKAAMDAMRDAIRKLRRRPERRAGARARAMPRPAGEQPVGTMGTDAAHTPPRAASTNGRESPAPAAPATVTRGSGATTQGSSGGPDPLVALIVGGWIAVLVLLPLAIKYGWRG